MCKIMTTCPIPIKWMFPKNVRNSHSVCFVSLLSSDFSHSGLNSWVSGANIVFSTCRDQYPLEETLHFSLRHGQKWVCYLYCLSAFETPSFQMCQVFSLLHSCIFYNFFFLLILVHLVTEVKCRLLCYCVTRVKLQYMSPELRDEWFQTVTVLIPS